MVERPVQWKNCDQYLQNLEIHGLSPQPILLTATSFFSRRSYSLDGTIHLKTLMTKVVLPDESTFSAETNMTNNTITGGMSIPEFSYYIYAFGLRLLQVTLEIVPVAY